MTLPNELPEPLLDLIYDAAADAALWSDALIAIADMTGGRGGLLFGVQEKKESVVFRRNGGLSETAHVAYETRHFHNPWSAHMFAQPESAIVWSDEILPLDQLRRTPFFREVLEPQDVAHNAMMVLAKRRDFVGAFNICRSERQGPFDEQDRRFFARLRPHLQRSLTLGLRVDGYGLLRLGEFHALDRISAGVILLDRQGSTLFANAAARRLADGGPLRLRGGGLSALSPPHARRLDQLISAALAGEPAVTMAVPHPEDGRLIMLLVSSIRGRDNIRFEDFALRSAAAMIFVFDPAHPREMPASWLTDGYGLTLAEARTALQASLGAPVAETAARLGVSSNTVKTHLRRVFLKTGVRNQAELARLIESIAAASGAVPQTVSES